jgi:hypothetical protein
MNTQNCHGFPPPSNGVASILGTTLYRSMSGSDSQNQGGMSTKHPAKTRHGLRFSLKRR